MTSFNEGKDMTYFAQGEGKHRVEAHVKRCGNDVLVAFTGGGAPHIGAAALAVPRPGISDPAKCSASASVLCVTGHKDDELARAAALRLAASIGNTVCVTVGIHIDNAAKTDICLLCENFSGLSARVAALLSDKAANL